jgi:iron complex transport system substrate-binding protein
VRIVSLLPSATEILFALGVGPDVVGVTFECDFPPEARTRRIVSTTTLPEGLSPSEIDAMVRARMAAGEDLYTLDEGALRTIDPDLVVTQDLCAVCAVDISEVDEALAHLGCRAEVLTLDPMTLDEVLSTIATVGHATGTLEQASELLVTLRQRLDDVALAVATLDRPRVAVLEWTDPPFSSGHWVPDMVSAAGAEPVIGAAGERSRRIEWSDVGAAEPDLVVVAPCGYRLDGATALAEQVIAAGVLPPDVPVWAVDADAAFVRPGPRVVDGVETLAHIAHPHSVSSPPGLSVQLRGASATNPRERGLRSSLPPVAPSLPCRSSGRAAEAAGGS